MTISAGLANVPFAAFVFYAALARSVRSRRSTTRKRAASTRMAAASSDWAPDPTTTEVVPGARGGVGAAGIHYQVVA